jgi:pyruvate dehydrogenase E1 component alpha subunit
MSDPGVTYRTRDEVDKARAQRDPIDMTKSRLVEAGFATADQLKETERAVRQEVQDALLEAQKSPLPQPEELYSDVLTTGKPRQLQDGRFRMESEPVVVVRMPDRTKSLVAKQQV